MSEQNRVQLVGGLWFFSMVALGVLFFSAALMKELTAGHVLIALTILVSDIVASPLLLRWKEDTETQQEKAKQRRIDKMLNDMSDDELSELKQRLSDSDFSENGRMNILGDDGELVRRR